MKIILLKKTQIDGEGKVYDKGTNHQVARDAGKRLVRQGKAQETDFVTSHEKIASGFGEMKKAEVELPSRAKELISKIKTISNRSLLKDLTSDKRVSVRTAAMKRLEQL